MATEAKPVHELLNTITDALTTAKDALPEDTASFNPPQDGISLLDVKNELLLSYLQHLVFLILLRLQNAKSKPADISDLGQNVVKKLIELKAFLERGVRPLEGRLRYQIDKVLRAAEDSERSGGQKLQADGTSGKNKKKKLKHTSRDDSDISASESDSGDSDDSAEAASDSDEDAKAGPGNFMKFSAAAREKERAATSSTQNRSGGRDGIYKPPRQNPTAMPTIARREDAEDTRIARRRKNALLDEYITEEHSSAPAAQPSIGSNNTILDHGRSHTSLNARDRNRERERREYEERNFTRLPAASKAERRKEKARQTREGRDMFGGEDWTGLGGLGDRVSRTVAGGRDRGTMLERREKRKRDTTDLPRGDGVGIGETFEKRRKVLQGRMDRKKNRR